MKRVGFVGGYEKTDFILYIAKVLVEMGNRVLFIDATITQKARYTVPSVKPGRAYITQYEGVDVAIGFEGEILIKQYLGIPQNAPINYDYVLIDIDSPNVARNYQIDRCEKNYFVTSFDVYSIKRGTITLNMLQAPIKMTKILFARDGYKELDEYVKFLTKESKIEWNNEEAITMPFEMGDQTAIYENQKVEKIIFKRLTSQYKDGISLVVMQLVGEQAYSEIRRVIKKLERGI